MLKSVLWAGYGTLFLWAGFARADPPPRETDFNFGWRFSLAQAAGAEAADFDDSQWREIRLPHDWSVEAAFDPKAEGCTGYLPGGIGWYRKHFVSPPDSGDTVTYLLFDGVYDNAEVWLNGTRLGEHPYGDTPFYYDITSLFHPNGADNVVAVKVDHSHSADRRWYTGSGIYRDVRLITTDRLHVAVWGTFLTTPVVAGNTATAELAVGIRDDFPDPRSFQLITEVFDPAGKKVATQTTPGHAEGGGESTIRQQIQIPSPRLWDLDHPQLYKAVTTVVREGRAVDRYATPFGVRTLRYDPDRGFFLNGNHTFIKGVCLHQDGGLVGTAVPLGVWRRRLATLKAAGCNAIRTAHNPPSAEFLGLCDELGLLVQEEFFDEWDYPKDKRLNKADEHSDYITRGYTEHFQQWAKSDLGAAMRRDRNHPSIIMWSIGNEIEWTYPQCGPASGYFDMDWRGNYFWTPPRFLPAEMRKRYEAQPKTKYMIGPTAAKLSGWTRGLDTTRPVVANLILPSVSYVSGYGDALDIEGFSYRRVVYDYGHTNFPAKMIFGTENVGQWHEWKAVLERPFVAGIFIWTGIDYLGEANDHWPAKGTNSGLLDFAGFEKPSYHMMKSLWSDAPEIYLATQTMDKSPYRVEPATGAVVEKKPGSWEHGLWVWQPVNEFWNYVPKEPIAVEVYSNCQAVELWLNGRSLGVEHLADLADRIYKWAVPFEPGTLVAKGVGGAGAATSELVTAGPPVAVVLTADRQALAADNYDVVHVQAQLVDARGNPVRTENRRLRFSIEGPVRVLGVDNGAVDNLQTYQADSIVTSQGRCLLLLQATSKWGPLNVVARTETMQSDPLRLEIR